MKKIQLILSLPFIFLLFSCEEAVPPLNNDWPIFEGKEFSISGTFDGNSIQFTSGSVNATGDNAPFTDSDFAYQSVFAYDDETTAPALDFALMFSISRDDDDQLTDVIKTGELAWAHPIIFPRDTAMVNLNAFTWEGKTTYQAIQSDKNTFMIDKVELLDLSADDRNRFTGEFYNVEGSLKLLLIDENQRSDTLELVIDRFSMLFQDIY